MSKISFFVPCYVDALAPQAAISSFRLLRQMYDGVGYIENVACCSLPLADMGYRKKACRMQERVIEEFAKSDYVVVPSGICVEELRNELKSYPDDAAAAYVAAHTYDIVDFLHDIVKPESFPNAKFHRRVALHVGCHALRGLHQASPTELVEKAFSKPAALLEKVEGIEIAYAERRDECCGFGGLFAIWDADCSGQMGLDKVSDYQRQGLDCVVSGDFSCLLHQQTAAKRAGIPLEAYHISEILNGDVRCDR